MLKLLCGGMEHDRDSWDAISVGVELINSCGGGTILDGYDWVASVLWMSAFVKIGTDCEVFADSLTLVDLDAVVNDWGSYAIGLLVASC